MRAHGHDHGANRHMCSGRAAETGRVGQGQGAGGAHTHKGCQSPIELVVGVSMEIGVGYCSVKWRFSAGERGRPSLLQGPWEGSYGKSKNCYWEVCRVTVCGWRSTRASHLMTDRNIADTRKRQQNANRDENGRGSSSRSSSFTESPLPPPPPSRSRVSAVRHKASAHRRPRTLENHQL